MTCSIELHFYGPQPELCRVKFVGLEGSVIHSVRGKTGGAYSSAPSFQWTSAVLGLSVVLLRHRLWGAGFYELACIEGGRGSIASSLDYAISKEPCWLGEMFGSARNGTLVAKRLFRITNSNRKRPGPVILGVNSNLLPASSVRVFLDQHAVEEECRLRALLEQLDPQAVSESCSTARGEGPGGALRADSFDDALAA